MVLWGMEWHWVASGQATRRWALFHPDPPNMRDIQSDAGEVEPVPEPIDLSYALPYSAVALVPIFSQ